MAAGFAAMQRHDTSFARLAIGIFALAPVVVTPPHAMALPSGPQVVAGRVDYTQTGDHGLVTQHTHNAIVNWRSFDIGAAESLRISQTSARAALLARVTGGDPTKLLGQLQADGRLFLINERGILVGAGARIDTAAFLASTLDVSDSDFLRGNQLVFKGDSAAGVVNLGTLAAREGDVFLFAHAVKNAGAISAPNGSVALAAGTEVFLASADAPAFLVKANLPASTEKTGVENSGVISAAQARLEAAGGSLYELAVNQSGVVRATGSARLPDGRVVLTAAGGTIGVSGTVTARDANGSGGEILVGGDYRGQNASVANATRTVVTSAARLDASSASPSAQAGRVIVWADDATRFRGTISATGAGGGFAEISGKRWLEFNPASPVSLGRDGTLLLDPAALVIGTAPDNGTSTAPGDPFVFGATSEPAFLNVATVLAQLALSNVVLDTSTSTGDITFNAALDWSGIANRTLTVRSGNNIFINADIIAGPGGTLALYTGRRAIHETGGELGFPEIEGGAELAENATLKVGTLVFGTNEFSAPGDGYQSPAFAGGGWLSLFGDIEVDVLELDLSAGPVGLATNGVRNAIGVFRTAGAGTLSGAFVRDHDGDLDVSIHATSTASSLEFSTPGKLTLKAGSAIAYENEGNPEAHGSVTLASTGGSFVNEAGANVFGANVRFLIYSNTRAATVKGGLAAADVFNHPYDWTEWFDDDVSRFFFTEDGGLPLLTYTALSFSRLYGANQSLAFTRAGLVDGIADDVTGQPALGTSATVSSGVGTYAINIGVGTLASSNYNFAFENGTLTINAAPLTVTANDFVRRLNAANPDFTVGYSGFVNGENASVLGGALSLASSDLPGSPAGAYTITPSGLTASNYAITFVPGVLTIADNIALTVTANAASRPYGAGDPAFTAHYAGLVGRDTASHVTGLQFSTSAGLSSGVGSYTITPYGATAEGYAITFVPATLTITPAPLTISIPGQGRLYGDDNHFTVLYNGLVNDDTAAVVSGLVFNTTATRASNVGDYFVVGAGASADNYTISYIGGTLSILPAPLTVTIDAATRHYGDADPVFTYSIAGLKNNDAAGLVSVHNLESLATAGAGVGAYGIVGFPFVSSGNYTVSPQISGTLTITPRPLTITADNLARVYGDANPALTASFNGLAPFDTHALFGDIGLTTQATQASGVGAWGITFGSVSNPNYVITSQFGQLTIAPAPLTILPLAELTRIYGRANPALTLPEVGGLKNADTADNLGLAFTMPALAAGVGTYVYALTTNNPNYTLTGATGEFRVTPAPLTVTIGTSGRVYGDANPSDYNLAVTGLAFDHTAASVIGVSNPAERLTNVGAYSVAPVLNDSNYYIESFTGGAFHVAPRELTLTASNRAKVYGDANPAFSGYFTGFADGDSESDIVAAFGFATNATRSSGVGAYAIQPSAQLASSNYTLTAVNGTLTVVPAQLVITIADAIRGLGQANPAFEVAGVDGLRNNDTLGSIGVVLSSPATTNSGAGSYPITGAASSANYTATFEPGTLVVGLPNDVVDLTQQLDPSRLTHLNGDTLINKDVKTTNETIEVEKTEKLTIAANPDVDYSTTPLTANDYANYLASFASQADAVQASMADGYKDFLAGKGKKDSAYESMSPASRALLKQWMTGQLTIENLRALIAAGDADATSAFGFILPTLVDLTRAKDIADMTSMDRQILGRLADLTEQRRTDTVKIARQKYDEMIAAQAKKAELNGLGTLFLGPGDFQAIVDGATQDAVASYLAATLPTAAVGGGVSAGVLSMSSVMAAIFPSVKVSTTLIANGLATAGSASSSGAGTAAVGPAVVVTAIVIIAVRSVQLGESAKNEKAYNDLIGSWQTGRQITSISELKSSTMDNEMKLSTLMLTADLLKSL